VEPVTAEFSLVKDCSAKPRDRCRCDCGVEPDDREGGRGEGGRGAPFVEVTGCPLSPIPFLRRFFQGSGMARWTS